MAHITVDQLFEQWRELHESGRVVLPEWLCEHQPELLPDLRSRIDLHLVRKRSRDRVDLVEAPTMTSSGGDTVDSTLLRHRLLWIACAFTLCGMAWFVWDILDDDFNLFDVRLQAANLAVMVPVALLLLLVKNLSTRSLRGIEFTIFAVAILYSSLDQFYCLDTPELVEPANNLQQARLLEILGDSLALPWVLLILVYGTFIPNRWQRCAQVVCIMVIIPVLITLHFAVLQSPPLRHLFHSLVEMSIWLVVAGVLTVWGVNRIEKARSEAEAAREFGQYRLIRPLGKGGMGEVFLAEHLLLDRPCAIKVIRAEKASDPVHLGRFEREVRTLASLTHWSIVQVYDFGLASDGSFYYVMEYLPGFDLLQVVRRSGSLPPERVVHLLRQACWGLREAHTAGLVHRDIKPSNIIVCERGRIFDVVKLVDFGLVQHRVVLDETQPLTREGAFVGTPAYMPPEQISGEPLDGRSDLYSLGAVAYFLLTGHPPFTHNTPKELLKAHLTEEVVAPGRLTPVPPDLNSIVVRCLAKNPAERYQDAESLERALASCSVAGRWSLAHAAAWWRECMLQDLRQVAPRS
ncbi:MAG: serine/threonine-protein kinase [Gemmataceae bacterium]